MDKVMSRALKHDSYSMMNNIFYYIPAFSLEFVDPFVHSFSSLEHGSQISRSYTLCFDLLLYHSL